MGWPVLKGNWRLQGGRHASFEGELEAVFTLVSLLYLEYGSRQRIEHSGFDADGIGGLFHPSPDTRFRYLVPDTVQSHPPIKGQRSCFSTGSWHFIGPDDIGL